MDQIICHLNNQTKKISLYKQFKIFKDKILKEFEIPMNDIIIYIIYNGLKIEIDENTYYDYIIEDTSITEIYCELTSQTEKEQLRQNIQQYDEKIKKYEKEIKKYKEKIKDLEEKYYKLKINFEEYKKSSNQKINGLYNQILELENVLNNKQNIPSQNDIYKNEEIPINRKKNVKTPKKNDYNLTNSELRRQYYNNYNNSSNNNNNINYNNSPNNNNNNINYNNSSNNNNFDNNNNSNSLYSSNKANNNLIYKVKKKLSCKIMIKEPTIIKNIKEIGNKLPIRVIIKLYNDGENIIPKQCNILRPVPLDPEFDNPLLLHADSIDSYDEFERANSTKSDNPFPISDEDVNKYYYFGDKLAFESICDFVEKMIADDSFKSDFYPSKSKFLRLKFVIRKSLSMPKIIPTVLRSAFSNKSSQSKTEKDSIYAINAKKIDNIVKNR